MERICQFSPDRSHRYILWREWDMMNQSYLMVIGLNPSTADEVQDDPTIRRCIGFAKLWGYGALCMTNIFAYRATLPKDMKKAVDPVGVENDRWLLECSQGAGKILAAWGTHGSYLGRADEVRRLLKDQPIQCLNRNADGSPKHPLYVKSITVPIGLL